MRKDIDITAGVPGLGLSGLFVLLSALTLPLTRRPGPRHGSRTRIGRLFWMAVVMAAAIVLSWEAISEAVIALHTRGRHSGSLAHPTVAGHDLWRLPVIAISASIMVLLVAGAEALLHLIGSKPTPTPPAVPSALPAEALPGDRHVQTPGAP